MKVANRDWKKSKERYDKMKKRLEAEKAAELIKKTLELKKQKDKAEQDY